MSYKSATTLLTIQGFFIDNPNKFLTFEYNLKYSYTVG